MDIQMEILLRVTVRQNRLFAEGEAVMPLEVWFVDRRCGSLTFNEQMAFIKKEMALYSWSVFPPGSICFYFDYDCFLDSLFVESVTKSYMFAPF